jgi:hypothetical protein
MAEAEERKMRGAQVMRAAAGRFAGIENEL